jgi:hypothetical protein
MAVNESLNRRTPLNDYAGDCLGEEIQCAPESTGTIFLSNA